MKRIVFATATVVMIAGCQSKPNSIGDACWSQSTKDGVNGLATKIVSEEIFDEYKKYAVSKGTMKASEEMPQRDKDFIKANLTVSAEDFFVKNGNIETGYFQCGAKAKMSFKRGEKQFSAGDQIFDFEVTRGEKGTAYLLDKPPFIQLVQQISDQLNALPQ